MNRPHVTCLQLSYGRPQLSVEAVESFLRQTYENKTLIIINTHHSPVWFEKNYDNIVVHNVGDFPYLADKYRYALSLVETPHLFIWDDDDIFLPWHIEDRVNARLSNDCDCVTHEVAFVSYQNELKSIESNMFAAQYLYDNNGHLPKSDKHPWDISFHAYPWKRHIMKRSEARPSYIYRWATGEAHISGGEQHKNYINTLSDKRKVDYPDPWVPMWRKDYTAEAVKFMESH